MIRYCTGDLLESDADALINTVNCKGVMGKGLALQFKKKYPSNFKIYKDACTSGYLRPGKMLTVKEDGKYIINFPTKDDWRNRSKIEYIEEGLESLLNEIEEHNLKSIAIPPLGCGNGGLDWLTVHKLIEDSFKNLDPSVEVYIYPPKEYISRKDDCNPSKEENEGELVKRTLVDFMQKKFSGKNGQYRMLYSMVLSNIIMGSDYFCVEYSGDKIKYEHLNEYLEMNQKFYEVDAEDWDVTHISGFQNEEKIVAISMNIIDGIKDPGQIKIIFAICRLFSNEWFGYRHKYMDKQKLTKYIICKNSKSKNIDCLFKDSIILLLSNKYILSNKTYYQLNVDEFYNNKIDRFPSTFMEYSFSDYQNIEEYVEKYSI